MASTSKLPPPTKDSKDVPDLNGQIILVTGGTAGIGKDTCRVLVERNAKVYLAARDKHKATTVIDKIRKSTGKDAIYFLHLDLADLDSVRKTAEEYRAQEKELHVLINNAGVLYAPAVGPLTQQGYDIQFGVHVLGHYLLTTLLMPTILSTAHGDISRKSTRVRVVWVSSDGHEITAPKQGVNIVQKGDASLLNWRVILAWIPLIEVVLISSELARKYGDAGLVSISLHPGGVKSELLRNINSIIAWLVEKVRIYPISLGVTTSLFAATSAEALGMNGEYLTAWARRQVPSRHAQNQELAAKLWAWCEEQVLM
ncbi:NAD-P-binding protein [Mycena kentingensis (nom. inval.)]|nr:NAD-P-binding protein [Mycena kentingensis (nom. inval.)]